MSGTRINEFNVNSLSVTRKGKLNSGGYTTDLDITDVKGNSTQITLFHDEPLVIQFSDQGE